MDGWMYDAQYRMWVHGFFSIAPLMDGSDKYGLFDRYSDRIYKADDPETCAGFAHHVLRIA